MARLACVIKAEPKRAEKSADHPEIGAAIVGSNSNVGDAEGIGEPPSAPIVALPPLTKSPSGLDIDPATGEPFRTGLIKAATALFLVAGATCFVGYWIYWWQAINIVDFTTSANLIHWFDPRPGSVGSVVLVCVMAAIGAAGVTGPWVAAYNTWNGASWSRWAGVAAIACAVITGICTQYWMLAAAALSAIATVPLFLPATRNYFEQWQQYLEPPIPPIVPPTRVEYGRTARFSETGN